MPVGISKNHDGVSDLSGDDLKSKMKKIKSQNSAMKSKLESLTKRLEDFEAKAEVRDQKLFNAIDKLTSKLG